MPLLQEHSVAARILRLAQSHVFRRILGTVLVVLGLRLSWSRRRTARRNQLFHHIGEVESLLKEGGENLVYDVIIVGGGG
jgi:hypothetical protein